MAALITKDSLTIKEKPQFAVSLLKNKLRQLCVSLVSEEDNLVFTQPESANLFFEKIEDQGNEEVFLYLISRSPCNTLTSMEHKCKAHRFSRLSFL